MDTEKNAKTSGQNRLTEKKERNTMMKKPIALALCLSLCLALCLCLSGAGAEQTAEQEARPLKIQETAAEGGAAAILELANPRYTADTYTEEGRAALKIWAPNGPIFPVRMSADLHMLNYYTVAILETAGTGFRIERILSYEVQADGTWREQDSTPDLLGNGPVRLGPYMALSFLSSSPAAENSRYEVIAVAGTDDNGHEQEFYGVIERLDALQESLPSLVTGNPDYDTDNLRYDADFTIKVSDGVWWVPANVLGTTRYTNREMAEIALHSPEEKQAEISTLYEAIQLFQVSGFTNDEDNVRITEDGISWEHHKPGRDAVRTNTGCCAAKANWLAYILEGDYERVGYIAWNPPEGVGHVFNYILQDGWYYVVDLTAYLAEDIAKVPESGNLGEYRPTRAINRVKDPEDYVKLFLATQDTDAFVFFVYQADGVSPIGGPVDSETNVMVLPEGIDFRFIDGREPGRMEVRMIPGPQKSYRWEGLKDATIKVKKSWLRDPEAVCDPLTAYRPGDELTLEDRSEKGAAVIDGIKYGVSRRDEVRFGFDDNLRLEGSRVNGVFNLTLPLDVHSEALENMDSLVLGNLTVSVAGSVPETQIILCLREGDHLTVKEVLDGRYYDSRPVSVRKDSDGSWTESPDYWYLVITNDRKLKYEFGRFRCVPDGGT